MGPITSPARVVLFFVLSVLAIAGPVGGGLYLGLTGPPPYILLHDRLEGQTAVPRLYPDGSLVTVHDFAGGAAARAGAARLLAGLQVQESRQTLHVAFYTRAESGRPMSGMIVPVSDRVVQVEAPTPALVEERFAALGFVAENPQKNLVYVLLTQYPSWVTVGLLVYAGLVFIWMCRLAGWAGTADAPPGTPLQPVEVLRERIQRMQRADTPLQVTAAGPDGLILEWRIADARWAGLMEAGQLKKAHRIHLRLDAAQHRVRAIDEEREVSFVAGIGQAGWGLSWFRGVSFFQYQRGAAVGLFISQDELRVRSAYQYRFQLAEMKNPLIEVITTSGWTYRPVVSFARLLSG